MWKVYVDIVIQQYGGNILDAIFIAVSGLMSKLIFFLLHYD